MQTSFRRRSLAALLVPWDRAAGKPPAITAGILRTLSFASIMLVCWAPAARASDIIYGSPTGLRLWDTITDTGGELYNNASGGWSNTTFTKHPTDPASVIYGSSNGIRIWDTVSNSDQGVYNNATGSWAGFPLSLHPTDPTLMLWGGAAGIRIWDTVANADAGLYNNAVGHWSSTGFSVLPSDPTKVLYAASAGIRIWDTVADTDLGIYNNADGNWQGFKIEMVPAAGRVPDGKSVPGLPLTIDKTDGVAIALAWDSSCPSVNVEYGIYEGVLGDFTSHTLKLCGTAGLTTQDITPEPGDTYYLVVPNNFSKEGSYGMNSDDEERPPGLTQCFPQMIGGCLVP